MLEQIDTPDTDLTVFTSQNIFSPHESGTLRGEIVLLLSDGCSLLIQSLLYSFCQSLLWRAVIGPVSEKMGLRCRPSK